MKLSAESGPALYGWLTWLRDKHPAEYRRFRRYGTPSDALVKLAVEAAVPGPNRPACPVPLSTRSGQDAAYAAMKWLDLWIAAVPTLVRWQQDAAYAVADTRRTAKARESARSILRYVLLRAAHDRNPQPLCAFESIQAAVARDVGTAPDCRAVHDVLSLADQSGGPLSVVKWGERGTFHRATVLRVDLAPFTRQALRLRERDRTDEWLMLHGHVLEAALRREELARRTTPDRKAAYAAAVEAKRAVFNAQAARFHDDLNRMLREGDRTLVTLLGEPPEVFADIAVRTPGNYSYPV